MEGGEVYLCVGAGGGQGLCTPLLPLRGALPKAIEFQIASLHHDGLLKC